MFQLFNQQLATIKSDALEEACCIVEQAYQDAADDIVTGCCGLLAEIPDTAAQQRTEYEAIVAEGFPRFWTREKQNKEFGTNPETRDDLYMAAIYRFQAAYHALNGEYYDPCVC